MVMATGMAVVGAAAAAVIDISAAGDPAADSTVTLAGVAGVVESGAARTATTTATATTIGAIIIVTATAIAGHAFPAFTIQAGTSVPALPGGD
jgi:hypothetical protein